MHGRPPADEALFPMAIFETVSAWVLEPSDKAAALVASQHVWTIVMADDQVGQTVARDVHSYNGDGRVELAKLVLGPLNCPKPSVFFQGWMRTRSYHLSAQKPCPFLGTLLQPRDFPDRR